MKYSMSGTITDLQRRHTRSVIQPLSSTEEGEAIPTNIPSLDIALGGGIPCGRLTEIYGPESTGKTTLALEFIASAQTVGHLAAFIDVEHSLDVAYAKRLGVIEAQLCVVKPIDGEDALDILVELIDGKSVRVVVLDSLAALMSEREASNQQPGAGSDLATLLSRNLRRLVSAAGRSRASVVLINQVREKEDVMFGNPETTPGGRAVRHYCSIRLETRLRAVIKHKGEVEGIRIVVRVKKSKVGRAHRATELDMYHDSGICRVSDMFDLALYNKLLDSNGSTFRFHDGLIGSSREEAIGYLKINPGALEMLRIDLAHQELRLACHDEHPRPVWYTKTYRKHRDALEPGKAE
jgi:recombination protein RecA